MPDASDTPINILAYPLDGNGNPAGEPRVLFNQTNPPACDTDTILSSPNSNHLAIQYNCHANQFTRLLGLEGFILPPPTVIPPLQTAAGSQTMLPHPISSTRLPGQAEGGFVTIPPETATAIFPTLTTLPTTTPPEIVLPHGYFLDWSPDGNWFLFRDTDTDAVFLVSGDGTVQTTLDNLPFGTYGTAFYPNGQQLLAVATRGLGFGSEIGTLNLVDGSYTLLRQFPDQIVVYPRWSPDGARLAYILMPDNNVPFPVGELWLANPVTAEPLALLGPADAGHGYPPVWSPDSTALAYVHRENPDSVRADQVAAALHSNLYTADVTTGSVTPLTEFSESLVYDPVWSPDGERLAFTANDAVWLLHLNGGGNPLQVSQGTIARHPTWLVIPVIPQP